MQRERALRLAELLREIREQDEGRFPDEAWFEIHKAFAIPYVELVILRHSADGGLECFLSRRDDDDPYRPGRPWHIPGGIWRVSQTREDACRTVAQRELGVSIVGLTEVMTFKWPDHPYANAIPHVCIYEPSAAPAETQTARFWSMSDLPQPMLLHHQEFLVACCQHQISRKDG